MIHKLAALCLIITLVTIAFAQGDSGAMRALVEELRGIRHALNGLVAAEAIKPIETDGPEIGEVRMFAHANPGDGWLSCNGSATSRTTYAKLFAKLSTTWGVGDGSTTFCLPDLRGRVPAGVGTGTGLTARALADTGGTETHVLTEAQMPAHSHDVTCNSVQVYNGASSGSGANNVNNDSSCNVGGYEWKTQSKGSGAAHNIMQPYAVLAFYVYAGS